MSFSVLRIVATAVILIDSLGATVRNVSNKRSNITLQKKYDIIFRSITKISGERRIVAWGVSFVFGVRCL